MMDRQAKIAWTQLCSWVRNALAGPAHIARHSEQIHDVARTSFMKQVRQGAEMDVCIGYAVHDVQGFITGLHQGYDEAARG